MSYTKGSWKVEGDRVNSAISCGCKHIAMVGYMDCGPGDPRSIPMEEHLANAALISAAPDLLEALEAVRYWLNERGFVTLHDRLINKAIQKARDTQY